MYATSRVSLEDLVNALAYLLTTALYLYELGKLASGKYKTVILRHDFIPFV